MLITYCSDLSRSTAVNAEPPLFILQVFKLVVEPAWAISLGIHYLRNATLATLQMS
jgi:hypothetical protein